MACAGSRITPFSQLNDTDTEKENKNMRRTSKSWKRRKLSYLEFFYGDNYKVWNELDLHDDRRLYCNIYELIKEALESLDDNPVNFVCVAMNKYIEENENIMDRVISNFNPI